MKNGRYFNFRDICNRNLWDTGYLVKKLPGYGILRLPLMGPHNSVIVFAIVFIPTGTGKASAAVYIWKKTKTKNNINLLLTEFD